jgi:hypothetical protein
LVVSVQSMRGRIPLGGVAGSVAGHGKVGSVAANKADAKSSQKTGSDLALKRRRKDLVVGECRKIDRAIVVGIEPFDQADVI